MNRRQIVITRGHVAQAASFVGGVALLLGILGLIWQGGLTGWVLATLAVAALGIGLWAVMTPQEFIGFVTGRQVRQGTMAVFSTLLLIGIVTMVYIVLQREVITLDMTIDNRFSLSRETRDVLLGVRRQEHDIQITGFYRALNLPVREIDDQFFRLYETESGGKIRRVFIDPEEQPAIAGRFSQRFGPIVLGNNVFISLVNADGSIDFETTARVPLSTSQERDVTGALVRLLASGTFTVYFEESHNELDRLDTSQEGLSGIDAGMRENGLITDSLSLVELAQTGDSIPNDASALIMARPTTPLTEAEIGVIDDYMKRGGALFIMADVLFNERPFLAEDSAFNRYLWENFGIRALDAVVVDPVARGQTSLDVRSGVVFGATDIGARIDPATTPTQFRTARALEIDDQPPVSNGRVIGSSEFSYGERNLRDLAETNSYTFDEGEDLPGPLTTVAWAWDSQETNAQVLLVGDSDFVKNGQITVPEGNAILFTDGIAWMTGLGEQVRFAPQALGSVPLLGVDGPTLNLIAFLTVILLPGVVLVAGLAVWQRRARR